MVLAPSMEPTPGQESSGWLAAITDAVTLPLQIALGLLLVPALILVSLWLTGCRAPDSPVARLAGDQRDWSGGAHGIAFVAPQVDNRASNIGDAQIGGQGG